MASEIERKFLLRDDSWREQISRSANMRQGYLVTDEIRSVRVRISDDKAHLNIKSATVGLSRSEYEYGIPLEDAEDMLDKLCGKLVLEKTRHFIHHGDHVWEIDVFAGNNAGLIMAEVELTDPEESFERPPWLGDEVSHDKRYYNAYLITHPYKDWQSTTAT